MFLTFRVYGLIISSDSPIPGLIRAAPGDCPPSPLIQVRLSQAPRHLSPLWAESGVTCYQSLGNDQNGITTPTLQVARQAGSGFFRFRYADGTEFLVRADGGEVAARWPARMTLEDTATYLVGPILGFVLRLRGVTCLHASAIAVGKQAILFMGGPGAGKSTAAAVLAQRGLVVVSDDISALDWRDGWPWVHPGYPRVNLWSESVVAAFGRSDGLPLITPGWEKRYVDLTQPPYQFASSALPVGAVFLLAPEPAWTGPPVVETVAPQQAVMSLVANTYANYLLDVKGRATEFEAVGHFVRAVPLRRVRYRPEPASFTAVPETILADCQTRSGMAPAP